MPDGGGWPPLLSQVFSPMWLMVAAGRDEGRGRAQALGQLEAEHAAIEAERAVEVGDLQMDMADLCSSNDGRILRHGASPLWTERMR